MFSAVVCIYINDPLWLLEKALKSIHEQELLPAEVVVVQDGPISNEVEVIVSRFEADLKSKKIIVKRIVFLVNEGHGEARRSGINNASYDIVAICDADDINLPNRFSLQYKYLKENPKVSVVGGYIEEYSNGRPISIRTVPTSPDGIKKYCRFRCPMNQMTVMCRRQEILSVGGYQDFYHNEDYFLWIRLINTGYQLANIPEILVNANVDPQTFVRRGGYRYFRSELDIQILLLRYKISNVALFVVNVAIRIFIQLLIPNSLRQYIFRKFFRN